MREVPEGIVEVVLRRTAIAWAAGTLCLLLAAPEGVSGLALGGGVSVGMLLFYRAVVKAWVRPDRWRRGRFVLAGIWLVKWPALGVLLYLALKEWQVSVMWFCVGIGLVPGMATAIAVWAAVAPRRGRSAMLETK